MSVHRIFVRQLTVPEGVIDANGHVGNLEYLRWMLDAAMAHSAALGWDLARYRSIGGGWIVRAHRIEYLAPGLSGDELEVQTWVSSFRRIRSTRRYRVVRRGDGAVLATGETDWVYVEHASGRPVAVPREVVDAFPIVPAAEEPGTGGAAAGGGAP